MGSQGSVRMTWSDICSCGEYQGRWVALDGVRYDEATSRPTEGTVIDADDDLAELCSRLRSANRRCCAVLHCDEPATQPHVARARASERQVVQH